MYYIKNKKFPFFNIYPLLQKKFFYISTHETEILYVCTTDAIYCILRQFALSLIISVLYIYLQISNLIKLKATHIDVMRRSTNMISYHNKTMITIVTALIIAIQLIPLMLSSFQCSIAIIFTLQCRQIQSSRRHE